MNKEDEILTTCALRFDGYEYQEYREELDNEIDLEECLENFLGTNAWNLEDNEKLTIFFILQRSLFKWGLEGEPKDGKYWKAFRSLFLECVDLPIPSEYKREDYCQEWEENYQPNLEQVKAFIQDIHDNTNYEW